MPRTSSNQKDDEQLITEYGEQLPKVGENATDDQRKENEARRKAAVEAHFSWPEAGELTNYANHADVQAQATGFLAHMATILGLYATVTGAAWAATISPSFGLDHKTQIWILYLHVALSLMVAVGIWGMGNNFIQRLNFSR